MVSHYSIEYISQSVLCLSHEGSSSIIYKHGIVLPITVMNLGVFGRMGEKREIEERRRHYNAKLMGSAFRPHDSEGLGDDMCGTRIGQRVR